MRREIEPDLEQISKPVEAPSEEPTTFETGPLRIPGKILYAIHYLPKSLILCKLGLLQKELTPLFQLATKRGWIEKTEGPMLLKELLHTKNTKELWENGAYDWHYKINKHNLEETHAYAGWMVLKNLETLRKQWAGFCFPYFGIDRFQWDTGFLAIKLQELLDIGLYMESHLPKEQKETTRHLCACILLEKQVSVAETLNKRTFKTVSAESKEIERLGRNPHLAIPYGIKSKEGRIYHPDFKDISTVIHENKTPHSWYSPYIEKLL